MKLYVRERGHRVVRALTRPAISELARVELPSAFWRKFRLGEIDLNATRAIITTFEADLFDRVEPRFVVVALDDSVLRAAATLLERYALRSLDAVQLASAQAARTADPSVERFACFDERLRTAASAERFSLVPRSTAAR